MAPFFDLEFQNLAEQGVYLGALFNELHTPLARCVYFIGTYKMYGAAVKVPDK
jgi:hypothetical protein